MPDSPDWRSTVDDQLLSQETRGSRRSIAVNYPGSLYVYVLEAAKQRGLSMTAFQRRASLAVACHDLGFDWAAEMVDEPAVGSFVSGRSAVQMDGFGFGPWRITEMGFYVSG